MERIVLITVALLAVVLSVQGFGDTVGLQTFCVDILGQTKADATQCSEKPSSYRLEGSDRAVVAFLCCLGAFGDVSINYILDASSDLQMYIASLKNEVDVIEVGYFVQKCHIFAKPGTPLTFQDYEAYMSREKTVFDCKA